jgi:hypothetical protein
MGLFCGKRLEVISDGALWISDWIGRLCGLEVYQILCWYHLCKRVCEGLSGLGASKAEREQQQREILGHLWHGNVNKAVEELKGLLPCCRVRERVEGLIDYLIRKRCLIPDYGLRYEQGFWIAGTRVEKWNDTAIAKRCKHRGMTWSENGVLAIALDASKKKRKTTQNTQVKPKIHTKI